MLLIAIFLKLNSSTFTQAMFSFNASTWYCNDGTIVGISFTSSIAFLSVNILCKTESFILLASVVVKSKNDDIKAIDEPEIKSKHVHSSSIELLSSIDTSISK
jgi:hypothetical protein